MKSRIQGSGLDTGTPSGADHRDIFRVAKKAFSVNPNEQRITAAHTEAEKKHAPLLSELVMREYLRPQATALREAKERGESYAAIKKRLAEPLTNAAATPYGCNQYGHKPGCPHAGGGVDPDLKENLEAALRLARRER